MVKRVFILLTLAAASMMAQEQVFFGIPAVRINEDGATRAVKNLSPEQAAGYHCVISLIGDKYYWTSRESKPLTRSESGAYITCHATDGSGYVRIQDSGVKRVLASIGGPGTFDYVEHLLLGLTSVTYYGNVK
jgi:hypothetical protein